MKIIAVTMVKNEENILESFARYALTFADQLIVFDHNSTDATLKILQALADEFAGRILIWKEEENNVMTINRDVFSRMIRHAFEQLGADLVMPLDSDEFPVLLNGDSVRNYLEQLDDSNCYYVHFMPFAMAKEWNSEVFAPLLFDRRKKIDKGADFKTFLFRKAYYHYDVQIGWGNHTAAAAKNAEDFEIKDLFPELFYAHFAFRDKEHLEGKLLLRHLALAMRNDMDKGTAWQYEKGYLQIASGQPMSQAEMDWYCLNNMCCGMEETETVEEVQEKIESVETRKLFPDIELKYTSEYSLRKTNHVVLMEFAQQMARQYSEKTKELDALKKEKEALSQKAEEAQNALSAIHRSKAWKLIQLYRKIMGKHDKTQD